MNDRQYECVLTLAEERSFSEAAKKLGISQPSLSQYIQKIEEECGNELFERSLPLKLTYAGKLFVSHAQNIINAKKQMEDILADVSNEEIGKIVLGAGPLNSMAFLPAVIAKYRNKYPKVEIKMFEMPERELLIKAEEGVFDLVISTQLVSEKKFEYISLFEEEILLAIRADHPFCESHNECIDGCYVASLEEALELEFIEMDENFPIQRSLSQQFAKYGITPKYVIKCSSIMTAYSLAREGIGAAVIPSGAIKNASYSDMKYYHLKPNLGIRPFGACYPKGKYISKALQAFIDCLAE
ncbi:MAG: LysR family transcriptional regulator [Lachnospiraceae bacterium]|nr:LysR family transcriptional regulator [Lachnospiraceae bacterium]